MAHIALARGPFAALRFAVDDLFQKVEQRRNWSRTYMKTMTELEKLTDRELSDIGYSRSDIADIAREAADKEHPV